VPVTFTPSTQGHPHVRLRSSSHSPGGGRPRIRRTRSGTKCRRVRSSLSTLVRQEGWNSSPSPSVSLTSWWAERRRDPCSGC
jgi:hypothetical protein